MGKLGEPLLTPTTRYRYEGLSMLEEFTRRNSPWNQLTEFLRQESYELPLKMTISAVRIAYRLAKFVLKP